jgi:cytochrome c2
MKRSATAFNAGLVFPLLILACLIIMAAQIPQTGSGGAASQTASLPAPTNLKVLPQDLSGQQVQDLMEKWKAGLGMDCAACHAEDREKVDAEGRPLLNFASDAKPQKSVARVMFTMTEEINTRYIAKIDGSGVPVTCGTCHRGHMGPDPFVVPTNQGSPKVLDVQNW